MWFIVKQNPGGLTIQYPVTQKYISYGNRRVPGYLWFYTSIVWDMCLIKWIKNYKLYIKRLMSWEHTTFKVTFVTHSPEGDLTVYNDSLK